MTKGILCSVTLIFGACAPDLRSENDTSIEWTSTTIDGTTGDTEGTTNPLETTGTAVPTTTEEGELGEGFEMIVDATDYKLWVYLDLESGELLELDSPADPQVWTLSDSDEWDLAFRRFNLALNGGVSGSGGVEVAMLDKVDYDTLTQAPADGYITDEPDSDDNNIPEYAFAGWYIYDYVTHLLTPDDKVYVVRTVEDNYFKFRIDDYYADEGVSGTMRITWAPLSAP